MTIGNPSTNLHINHSKLLPYGLHAINPDELANQTPQYYVIESSDNPILRILNNTLLCFIKLMQKYLIGIFFCALLALSTIQITTGKGTQGTFVFSLAVLVISGLPWNIILIIGYVAILALITWAGTHSDIIKMFVDWLNHFRPEIFLILLPYWLAILSSYINFVLFAGFVISRKNKKHNR